MGAFDRKRATSLRESKIGTSLFIIIYFTLIYQLHMVLNIIVRRTYL